MPRGTGCGIIVEAFSALTAEQVIARLDEARIANSRANDMPRRLGAPRLGPQPLAELKRAGADPGAASSRFLGGRRSAHGRGPALGQHTDAILSALGYAPERIKSLRAERQLWVMSLPTTYPFRAGQPARPVRQGAELRRPTLVILDLEDAVDPASKDAAQEAVGVWLDSDHATDGRVLIRINDDTDPWYGRLPPPRPFPLRRHRPAKAERADQIAALPKGELLVPLIETARGLRAVDEIAAADRGPTSGFRHARLRGGSRSVRRRTRVDTARDDDRPGVPLC